MADYYSLLARAVANLPKSAPPSTRRAIYDRARKALTNQLRSLKPQLPESDIAREERALDEAVARLESDFEPTTAEVHVLPTAASAPVEQAPPPAAPSLTESPPSPPAPAAPAPSPSPALAHVPPAPPPAPSPPRAPEPAAAAPQRPAPPRAPATLKPPVPARSPNLPLAASLPSAVPMAAAAGVPNAMAFDSGPPLGAASRDGYADADGGFSPAIGGAEDRMERSQSRPTLTDPRQNKGVPAWLWIVGAIAVGFAVSIAVAAFIMRPALRDLTPPAPVETAPVPSPDSEKMPLRVAPTTPQTGASGSAVAPTTPAPSEVASPPQTSPPTAVASETPTSPSAGTPAPSAPAASPPAQAAQGVPIASRAAMLVATVADAAKPSITVGTAVWSLIPAPPGQPNGVGVKAEIDVPDLKMHASMILRKNFDASLPASHTIDLRVTFDPGSPIKGVRDIALPLMRRDDPPAADALAGVRVKISDNYFLIGLNRGDADVQKNLQAIAERSWFDFPMQLDDDRIAKLTFEKGADGDKVISQALAAWK